MLELFTYIRDNQPNVNIPFSIKIICKFELKDSDLDVNGDVDISRYKGNLVLPNNLKISGKLYLYKSNIRYLPKKLYVGRWLDIAGTGIRILPDDLYVDGEIFVDDDLVSYFINKYPKYAHMISS